MADNFIAVPARWRDESEIAYVRCGSWATGGSERVRNAGTLNAPVNALLANDKWLKNLLTYVRDKFAEHLEDEAAHREAMAAQITAHLNGWAIPPSKIKTSLTPDAGITDKNVEIGAAIAELKLKLAFHGSPRPAITASTPGTYANTAELAEDLRSLFYKVSGQIGASTLLADWGRAAAYSGWLHPFPVDGSDLPLAFVPDGNRIVLRHDPESFASPHVLVAGRVFRLLHLFSRPEEETETDEQGNPRYPGLNAALRNVVAELGVEEPGRFDAVTSPGLYTAEDGASREDTVFLEVWREAVDRARGVVFPFGNVQYKRAANAFNGFACHRYPHTDEAVPVSDPAFADLVFHPENQVESGEGADLAQWRIRVRLEKNAKDLDECSPQGTLPVGLQSALDGSFKFAVSEVDAQYTLTLVSDGGAAGPFTGTPLRVKAGTVALPLGLDDETVYYAVVPDAAHPLRIRLAASASGALAGETVPVAPGNGYDFTIETALAVPETKSVAFADLPKLFAGEDGTAEGVSDPDGVYEAGMPVSLRFEGTALPSGPEPAFDNSRYFYYVHPEADGWIGLYQHEDPADTDTPLRRIVWPETARGELVLVDANDPDRVERIRLDEHTLDAATSRIRTERRWDARQRVRPVLNPCRAYARLESGDAEGRTLFVARRTLPDGTDGGVFFLAETRAAARVGEAAALRGANGAGTVYLEYAPRFHRHESDPGLWVGDLPVSDPASEGTVYAIPLFTLHRRNAGVWHPEFNPNGTALDARDVPESFGLDVSGIEEPTSFEDCFDPDRIAVYAPARNDDGTGSGEAAAFARLSDGVADPDGNRDFVWVGGKRYYRSGYSAVREEGRALGVSGRPDGFFYDAAHETDILDRRRQVALGPVDFAALMGRNLDALFRGVLRTELYEQPTVSGEGSGIFGSNVLQVDVLADGENLPDPDAPARIINHRRVSRYGGETVFSYDPLDGLRRVWSDRPAVQVESDVVHTGAAPGNPGNIVQAGAVGDENSDEGIGDRRLCTFAHSYRLGDDVSPQGPVTVEFEVWKFRSFSDDVPDGEAPPVSPATRVNRVAATRLRLYRGSKASGDDEGATGDQRRKAVKFAAPGEASPYRVYAVTLTGTGSHRTVVSRVPVPVSRVELSEDGTTAYIDVVPFPLPAPLREERVYRLFEVEPGVYRLANDLSPAAPREALAFVADREDASGALAAVPVFGPWQTVAREGVGADAGFVYPDPEDPGADHSYFLADRAPEPGLPVALERRRFVNGVPETVPLPETLAGRPFFHACPDGRVTAYGRTRYKVRLSETKEDALRGKTVSFGEYPSEPGTCVVVRDLFADGFGISAAFRDASVLVPEPGTDGDLLRPGTPVKVRPLSGGTLPAPLDPSVVYRILPAEDGIRLARSAKAWEEGLHETLEGDFAGRVVLAPASPVSAVDLPSAPTEFEVSSDWRTGTALRVAPVTPAAFPIDAGIDPETVYFAVRTDGGHLRLANSAVEAYGRAFLDVNLPDSGVAALEPVDRGLEAVYDASGSRFVLPDFGSYFRNGWKTRLSGVDPTRTQNLSDGVDYWVAKDPQTGKFGLCPSYEDALDGRFDERLTAAPGYALPLVGWPAVLGRNRKDGRFIVPSGTDLEPGCAVEIDYFDGTPFHTARLPEGFFRRRTYYVCSVEGGDGLPELVLSDSLADALDGKPVVPAEAPEEDVFLAIRPLARREPNAAYATHRRLDAVYVDRSGWETGTPLRLRGTQAPSRYPLLSGIRPDDVVYAVNDGNRRLRFAASPEEAIRLEASSFVQLDRDGSRIDPDAHLELALVPQGEHGDPYASETIRPETVDPDFGRFTGERAWWTGTPLTADADHGTGLTPGTVYYACRRKTLDPNTGRSEFHLSRSLAAAHAYERHVVCHTTGEGAARLLPLNRAEVVHPGGLRTVLPDDFYHGLLRNTVQTGQTWTTGTPVRVSAVAEGRLPQYVDPQAVGAPLGTAYDLPLGGADAERNVVAAETPPGIVDDTTVRAEAVGNDLPSGLDPDRIYFVSSVSAGDPGEAGVRFKLASSFHEALTGGGVAFGSLSDGGALAVSRVEPPEAEDIGLGAGRIDTDRHYIETDRDWPTGTPLTVRIGGGGQLPQGVSADEIYFAHSYGPGKIRLLRNLSAYYRYLFRDAYAPRVEDDDPAFEGGGLGYARWGTPDRPARLLRIQSADGSAEDLYAAATGTPVKVRLYVDRTGYTTDNPLSGTAVTQIDRIRVGSIEVAPPQGEFFESRFDGGIVPVQPDREPVEYIEFTLPAYGHDAVVEIALRKRTGTETRWSEPRLFVFTSRPDSALMVKISPLSVVPGWDNPNSESMAVWKAFDGRIRVAAYLPPSLANRPLALRFDHPHDGDVFTGPNRFQSFSTGDVAVEPLEGTPFSVLSFRYDMPVPVTAAGRRSVAAAVRLVRAEDPETPVSSNALPFYLVTRMEGLSHIKGSSTLPVVVDVGHPLRGANARSIAEDLVFAGHGSDARVRLVVPLHPGTAAQATVETPDGGRIAVPARPGRERWGRRPDGFEGTTVPVLYVTVPGGTGPGGFVTLDCSSFSVTESVVVPRRENDSPVVGHTLAASARGGELLVFSGSNLDSVEDVVFQNENAPESAPAAVKTRRVRIVRRSFDEIAVLAPPYTQAGYGGGTPSVRAAFFAPSGTGYAEVEYTGDPVSPPVPQVYGAEPGHLYYPETDIGGPGTPDVTGELAEGTPVTLFGRHLSAVARVVLTFQGGSGAEAPSVDEASRTVVIDRVRTDSTHAWFNLPRLTGLRRKGSPAPLVWRIDVETADGVSTRLLANAPVLKLVARTVEEYGTRPVLTAVTPASARNDEDFVLVVRGRNLADTVSVRVGHLTFAREAITFTPGVGGADDVLQLFVPPSSQSGIVPVSVRVRSGEAPDFTYHESNPLRLRYEENHYAQFRSEGLGVMRLQPRGWTSETVTGNRIKRGLSLLELNQRIPSGVPVRFRAEAGSSLPPGIEEGKVYYTVESPYRRIRLRPHNKASGVVSLSFDPSALETDTVVLVDLPRVPDPNNPQTLVVDWSEDIARYTQRIPLTEDFVDPADGSLLVSGSFFDTFRVVAFSRFDPPRLVAGAEPDGDGSEVSGYPIRADGLPVYSPFPDWKTADLGGRTWDPVLDADREYDVIVPARRTHFVGVAASLAEALGASPSLIDLSDAPEDVRFTVEVADDAVSELVTGDRVRAAHGLLQSVKAPDDPSGWRDGMPVRLGSVLPKPLRDGKTYRARIVPGSGLALAEAKTGFPHDGPVNLADRGYGYVRLTVDHPELAEYETYYVEDAGAGRIRLALSLGDLYAGRYLRIAAANDGAFLLKPQAEIHALELSPATVDLSTGELALASPHYVSGTPFRFRAEDGAVLPEGIFEDRTYYAFRSSPESVRLYEDWRDAALLADPATGLVPVERPLSPVTLTPRFVADRVRQTVATDDAWGNINLAASTVALNVPNASGAPVTLAGDKPVLSRGFLTDPNRAFEIVFPLRYPPGGGLTDRPVRTAYEARRGVPRFAGKSAEDTYWVRDARFRAPSTGAESYWEDLFQRLDVNEAAFAIPPDAGVTPEEARNALAGHLKALAYCDAFAPGATGLFDLVPDETSVDFDAGDSGEWYYDADLPPHLRGRDLYIAAAALRLDWEEESPDGIAYRKTAYAGIPFHGGLSAPNDPAEVFGRIEVAWRRDVRMVEIRRKGVPGMKNPVVTFRFGFVEIDRTAFSARTDGQADPEDRRRVPDNPNLPDFDGRYDVGVVYEALPQCREVALTAVKRLVQMRGGTGSPGWDAASEAYADAGAFGNVLWVGEGSGEGQEMLLAFTQPRPCRFEGGRAFAVANGGDLSPGSATFFQEGTPSQGGVVDFLYWAGYPENPRPVRPPKPKYGDPQSLNRRSGTTYVCYRRTPKVFETDGRPAHRVLPQNRYGRSCAGSGGTYPAGETPAYPYLGHHVLTPHPLYRYVPGGVWAESPDGTIREADSSFLWSDAAVFENARPRPGIRLSRSEALDDRASPFYNHGDGGPEPFLAEDGQTVRTPLPDGARGPRDLPDREAPGSRSFRLEPNLVVENGEVKGVLTVRDGEGRVEMKFSLRERPLLRIFPNRGKIS